MAVNWTTLEIQLAQELRALRKRQAAWEHFELADNANYDRRLYVATNAYSTSDNDQAQALATNYAHLDGVQVPGIASLWTQYRSNIESLQGFFGVLYNELGAIPQTDIDAGAIDYEYTDTAGAIAISERRGFWGALRRQMVAESKLITPNAVSFGSFTAASGNVGTLAVTSMTGSDHTLSGTVIFEVESETIATPKIRVSLALLVPLPDGTTIIEGDNLLQPEKSWQDGPTGLTITLTRSGLASPTEAGDNGAMFASSSISNPQDGDSDKGKIYMKVTRQSVAPIWLIQWYRASAQASGDLVQQTTTDTTSGTFAVDMTGANGMRFQSTFDRAAANTHLPTAGNTDSDITFDIGSPRLGDRWTRTDTNDYAGNFATKIANGWRASLNSGVATFTDANASSISMT